MSDLLGVIMAGGRNTRFGTHKALARVGGRRILDRVRAALVEVAPEIVLVANEPEVYGAAGLPLRGDVRPGTGVLGVILTALQWARERGRSGALVVACDMPFVPAALLREIAARTAAQPAPDVVAPESGGKRGVEPLCAWYGTGCIGAVERALDRDDRRVVAFFDEVRVERIPLEEVRRHGDPDVMFLNVNTPEERERAERLAAAEEGA